MTPGCPFFIMEKVINLKNDQILRHAVQYNDALAYPNFQSSPGGAQSRAADVREAIYDLVIQGKLDPTDLKIIAARDCSPMPSSRAVARQIEIAHSTVLRRLHHIKRLITKATSTITPA